MVGGKEMISWCEREGSQPSVSFVGVIGIDGV